MESSKLIDAITSAIKTFQKGNDAIAKATAKATVQREVAINYLIDTAKAEGLKDSKIVMVVKTEVFGPLVESGDLSKSTAASYKTGIVRALFHKVAWYAGINNDPKYALPETAKKKGGRKVKTETKAVTVGTVKVDRKARTVSLTLGKSTDLGMFTDAITAIQSEPARIALFLNYCKAQGWIKAEAE